MWEKFSLESLAVPVIQGPMSGFGITTPELVAAVCEAGGLGSVAAAYRTPDQIAGDIEAVRKRTDLPYAVNLFAPGADQPLSGDVERMLAFLARWHERLGLPAPEMPDVSAEPFEAQMEVILGARPAVVSFTFGILPPDVMRRLKEQGTFVIGTASTVTEARRIEAAGADAVVALGAESGGHRSTFVGPVERGLVGTMALVPQVADAVSIPVVAAGGIADARGIRAAKALGAGAVQMGTAFLLTEESGAPEVYKQAVRSATAEDTEITKAFSGRPARGIRNAFMREMEEAGIDPLPYPWQNALTRPLRTAGVKAGDTEVLSLWCGQGAPLAREGSVAELMAKLAQ